MASSRGMADGRSGMGKRRNSSPTA
jgi:hypothetical protein